MSWRTVCPTAVPPMKIWRPPRRRRSSPLFFAGGAERYFHLEPLRELGARLGLSEGQVKSRLHRMRRALKAELEREGVAV